MVVRGNGDLRSSRTQKRSGASEVSKSVEETQITNKSPSSLGERSNARKTNRVAWGKVLEWVTKASLLSFRDSFSSSAPPILAKLGERGCDLPRGEGGPGFEPPSKIGVLACTHLLHRGP
jgi:hypothetical protein